MVFIFDSTGYKKTGVGLRLFFLLSQQIRISAEMFSPSYYLFLYISTTHFIISFCKMSCTINNHTRHLILLILLTYDHSCNLTLNFQYHFAVTKYLDPTSPAVTSATLINPP